VPDFVRESMARIAVPGFKIFRWEREWHTSGQPFRDPAAYPQVSVAASGTHDTETLAAWWDGAPPAERQMIAGLPTIARVANGRGSIDRPFDAGVRDVILEALSASGSDLVILPVQDVFGWRDRINEPAVMGNHNWIFRLPWDADRLNEEPEARERQAALRAWSQRHDRG
jgi:4-alpha-glucanotransferase